MNTMVSAASLTAAATVAAPSIASTTHTVDTVSFPSLVAKFVRVRERWRSRSERDQADSDKIKRLFYDATGIDDWAAIDYRHPRFEEMLELRRKIINENPSDVDDPVDETGCSIDGMKFPTNCGH
jgi:hypothetical protein